MLATANKEKTQESSGKNASKQTWKVEISKEEIPGSKRSMHGYYADLLQALKWVEPLTSGFSTDETFLCASAVPHCG